MADGAVSVRAVVQRWAQRVPERVCLSFHAEHSVEQVTYGALAGRASAHARLFRERGLAPGDAIVLLAHSTPGFVAAFLGAQEAGLLAVPCPPPEPLESARRVGERMREILARCRARAMLASTPLGAELSAAIGEAGVDMLAPPPPDATDLDHGADDAHGFPLAYCQFTSGSGGRAKGVLLTHDTLAANIRSMARCFDLSDDDSLVTWLPLHHDMGLISYILMPLVLGHPGHVMSPLAFIARPLSWLALMTRVRGTMASAPNFAYGLCARKVTDEEAATLDLSAWRRANNASEPITRAAVEAFCRRFAPCGFLASALLPNYGLAENTLCATSRRPGEGTRFEEISRAALEEEDLACLEPGGLAVASVGRVLEGQKLAVVDSRGQVLGDRRIGEVVIWGDSVMQGYLPGTEGELALSADGALSTGDLGYLADGELFLVGRKKDLIIRAGRNHYPQDIEGAIADIRGLRPGRTVAFSAPGPESEFVIVAAELADERGDDVTALRAAIHDAVFSTTRILADDIVLLPRNSLPLTSSGKVMRPEARRLYLAGHWRDH